MSPVAVHFISGRRVVISNSGVSTTRSAAGGEQRTADASSRLPGSDKGAGRSWPAGCGVAWAAGAVGHPATTGPASVASLGQSGGLECATDR